jgi:hypothetical protein
MSLLGPNGLPLADPPKPTERSEPEILPCATAIVVYTLPDGRVMATSDLNAPLAPEHEPRLDEIERMASVVARDAVIQISVQSAMNTMMDVQRQMAEARAVQGLQQAQAAKEAAAIEEAFGKN